MKQQYLFQAFVESFQSRRELERDHAPPPRKWYRFTIWTLLVRTTLLLLAVSHFWTSIQLGLARNEVQATRQQMRDKLAEARRQMDEVRRGYSSMAIEHPYLTHVLYLPQSNMNFWQWRLYVPQGQPYQLYFTLNYPYQTQRTPADWRTVLSPGEGMVSFQIVQREPGEFEVVRTIDWVDEGSQGAPTRIVDSRKLDLPDDSWLRDIWSPLAKTSAGDRVQIKELEGLGYLQQRAYDPRDLLRLVDLLDREGKQASGVYIWLEPVNKQ